MNRLVIIGNGFDLAHGLPTGYCDFINDYWQKIPQTFYRHLNKQQYRDELLEVFYEFNTDYHDVYYSISSELNEVKNYGDFKNFIQTYSKRSNPIVYEYMNGCKLIFKNNFFKRICEMHSIKNWVDVENEYYNLLKDCLKNGKSIIELNKHFDEVKLLLQNYLIKNVEETFQFSAENVKEIIKIFKSNTYTGQSLERFYLELPKKDEKEFERRFENEKMSLIGNKWQLYKPSITINNYFISFNYTSTIFKYNNLLENDLDKLIEIHGVLLDENNPINFGFGDEMDKHYQEIEEINDNEYLKNIKSFQYLHTPNYKRLLDLIDNEHFQVYIMGHSCGLSDRTLLNTIFEHENCRSIKVFYHEIKAENGKAIKDNYTEITQNISRHFNKKKLMREKIVNKTLCQPLPQIQLPKKQNDPQL